MKTKLKHLCLTAVFALPVLLGTACNSVKRADFYRYYSPYDGSCTEVSIYNGIKGDNQYAHTNLAMLFQKYPEAKAPQDAKKTGAYFYFATKEDSAFGAGTGDYAERAAFLLLEMDDSFARQNAMLIRTYLIQDNSDKMRELFESIAQKAGVVEEQLFSETKPGIPEMIRDYKIEGNGSKIAHGLTRLYQENGMIAGDTYYRNGKQVSEFAHKYKSDGTAVK